MRHHRLPRIRWHRLFKPRQHPLRKLPLIASMICCGSSASATVNPEVEKTDKALAMGDALGAYFLHLQV
jgi:hypothetical protein